MYYLTIPLWEYVHGLIGGLLRINYNFVITFPKIGEVPKALCVAGLWSWPKESSRVDHSYPLFRDWGMDFNNEKFKDWYEKPDHDKIVKF